MGFFRVQGCFFFMFVSVWPNSPITVQIRAATGLHWVRPLSKKKIKILLGACKNLVAVSVSPSVRARLKPEVVALLEKQGIGVRVESRRGRPLSSNMEAIVRVAELRKDFQPIREIERLTKIPKSSVHYLLTRAKRSRVKKRGHVVHV